MTTVVRLARYWSSMGSRVPKPGSFGGLRPGTFGVMSPGLLISVFLFGGCVALQLLPVRSGGLPGRLSFWTGLILNEQPHWFALLLSFSIVTAIRDGEIASTGGWIAVGLAALVVLGLLVLLARAFTSRESLRDAITGLDPAAVDRLKGRRTYALALVAPFAFGRSLVRRIGNIEYGPVTGRANRLDLYLPRGREVTGPTLIYLHGGRFRSGDKRREAKVMLYRLAAKGWLTISANYRLSPEGRFPDYLVDLKRVIAWAKSDGLAHGVDPERILLAGSSVGAHISAMAGLTPGLAKLQPGLEEADTSVQGVVGLYGYYGRLSLSDAQGNDGIASSPVDHVAPGAPPFLLIDAGHDTLVPATRGRTLAAALKREGAPVVLAELPGAQHSYDLLRSVRVENTVDAIEDFVSWATPAGSP